MTKMKKLRIAVVAACPFPHERGTPIRIRRLAEGLAARGHEIHVATYHLGDPVDLPGVQIHRIRPVVNYTRKSAGPSPRKLLVLDPLLVARLRGLLAQRRFDVIHAHHIEGLLVARLARRAHLPIVSDAHTALAAELPFYGPALAHRPLRYVGATFDRFLPLLADHVVTVTPELRARLIAVSRTDPKRVTTVGNGLEWSLFEQARRRAAAKSPGSTVVYTGNLAGYQGIELMMKALAHVRMRRPDARLSIVSGEKSADLESLARAFGVEGALCIAQADFEKVPEALAEADVAVNPRVASPGIAQKTLNYMAMGLPIVSFAGSGHHLVDGETALLVDDGDVAGFADAIVRLLEDRALARKIGRNAQRVVREKNDWARSSELLEKVLLEVALRPEARRPDVSDAAALDEADLPSVAADRDQGGAVSPGLGAISFDLARGRITPPEIERAGAEGI
jgi:glycosyltransferase involved in cell wall biosynthesis